MVRPPKQNIRRRRAKKEPAPQNEPCKKLKPRESNKKVKIENPYRVSFFYQRKQLRSEIFGCFYSVKALLIGFLSAAATIEDRTNSKGKRGEKHNSYFYLVIYCFSLAYYDREIEKYRKIDDKYEVRVMSVKFLMQMIGGLVGVKYIKENEYAGGIFGSFVGLVGSVVVIEKYNWFSQNTVRR